MKNEKMNSEESVRVSFGKAGALGGELGGVLGGDLGGDRMELRVYTRYEHGNLPVRVYQDSETGETTYEVSYASGKRVFVSARKLISELYGHDVHMPFDRYFRLGRYRPVSHTGSANLLHLLDSKSPEGGRITVHAPAKTEKKSLLTTKIAVSEEKNSKNSLLVGQKDAYEEFFEALKSGLGAEGLLEAFQEGSEKLWTPEIGLELEKNLELELDRLEERVGIDLVARGHEVRKLLFAGFAGKMLSRGYDPEDVLQEIFRGLVVRNRGKCPWDKRKSSFGHYVHMAINCILTNYHRKESKRVDRDYVPLEIQGEDGQELPTVLGSAQGSVLIHAGSELGDQIALLTLQEYLENLPDRGPEAQLGRKILPWVTAGCTRREIVQETGYKESLVSRALAWVRHQTALWATEMGMGRVVPLKYRMSP
jgi:DNA-directed RNA polymerase specialized sigma24 family protein